MLGCGRIGRLIDFDCWLGGDSDFEVLVQIIREFM